jgi:mannose-6-phosphate isomerase-like protein (cupin superfamily)
VDERFLQQSLTAAYEESLKSFATLAAYRDDGIFATHFSGSSGWERHPQGDEVVQILEGATRFDILVDAVMQSLELSAGMLVVVPKWTPGRLALLRRQMPRVRRRLVIHHPQDGRVHRVHAHHGRQL